MPFPEPLRLAPLLLLGALTGCLAISKGTFDSTTGAGGTLKASDAASHSSATIRRDGREVVVQEAYRFDLARLVEVDAGYVPGDNPDEAAQTKDETIITMAIHGAFGMGVFNSVLGQIDTPWAKQIMAQTTIGRPFLVRSISAKRDDYYVVPVFYKRRWGVANHVGVTPRGTYYSNGFTVPNMPIEKADSSTAFGRSNLERLIGARFKLSAPPERVWLETEPPQEDAVIGYCWLLKTDSGIHLIDTRGKTGRPTPEQAASLLEGRPLEGALRIL